MKKSSLLMSTFTILTGFSLASTCLASPPPTPRGAAAARKSSLSPVEEFIQQHNDNVSHISIPEFKVLLEKIDSQTDMEKLHSWLMYKFDEEAKSPEFYDKLNNLMYVLSRDQRFVAWIEVPAREHAVRREQDTAEAGQKDLAALKENLENFPEATLDSTPLAILLALDADRLKSKGVNEDLTVLNSTVKNMSLTYKKALFTYLYEKGIRLTDRDNWEEHPTPLENLMKMLQNGIHSQQDGSQTPLFLHKNYYLPYLKALATGTPYEPELWIRKSEIIG